MSSDLRANRICEYCRKEFTARTTTTRYCSRKCNSRAYKAKVRQAKINKSIQETRDQKNEELKLINSMEFLTVRQAAILLNCSRQNVYKMINAGKLPATNILQNKTLIERSAIDDIFKKAAPKIIYKIQVPKVKVIQLEDCYTTTEVRQIFNISDRTLKKLIDENDIPKVRLGRQHYVPKAIFHELLKK